MAISDPIIKRLYGESANRCNMPACQTKLNPDNANIGEMAHIISSKKNGPRHAYLPDYDTYDNLILMCRNHHKIIDTNVEMYPVEYLKQIKAEHIQWVNQNLETTNHRNGDVTWLKGLLQHMPLINIPYLLKDLPYKLHLDIIELENIFDNLDSTNCYDQQLSHLYIQMAETFYPLINFTLGYFKKEDSHLNLDYQIYLQINAGEEFSRLNYKEMSENVFNDIKDEIINKTRLFFQAYNEFKEYVKNSYPEVDIRNCKY